MRPLFVYGRPRWVNRLCDITVAVISGIALGWLAAQGF